MFLSYKAVAPDVSEFPKLLDAMGALMREPIDYSDAVAKLTMPVMLIYGDADMIRPEPLLSGLNLVDKVHGVDSTRIRAFGDDLGHERGTTPCGTRIASFMIF